MYRRKILAIVKAKLDEMSPKNCYGHGIGFQRREGWIECLEWMIKTLGGAE